MKKNKPYFYMSIMLIAVLLTLLLINYACQKKEKSYVLGFINPNPLEEEGAQGFLRNMPEFGFIEGKNLTYMKTETKDVKVIDNAINDMVAKPVDLIFTMSTPAAKLAKKATEGGNIPVVFVMYNAAGSGVIESLVRPGGNLTGIQLRGSTPKSLEFLRAIAPDAKHIFVPVKFDTGAARQSLKDLNESAAKAGFKITVSEVATVEELHRSLSSMPGDVDAIFPLHSWLVGSNLDVVLDYAIKRKIPVISAGHVDYKKGVVLSYSPTDERTGSQAARLAHSILKGTPPADLPVETADFFLGINLKTAQAVGIEIPNDILQQADFIIRE